MNLKELTAIIAIAYTAILSGCTTIDAKYYPLSGQSPMQYAPNSVENVQLFITKKPDYQYKELGMITYTTPDTLSDEIEVFNIMKRKAAEIGADAIIIIDSQSTFQNTPNVNYDMWGNPLIIDNTRTNIKYRGIAIKRIATATKGEVIKDTIAPARVKQAGETPNKAQ